MMQNRANTKQRFFLPKHIAIVMDGNGRWAQQRMLPRVAGHHKGVESVRKVVKYCAENKILALTLFAFSSENWNRPQQEVKTLMSLLMRLLKEEIEKIHENNINLTVIGELELLSFPLQEAIKQAQELTKDNTGLNLNIAINYGGRWDITNAAKKIAQEVAQQKLDPQQITETIVANNLSLVGRNVDLFIRTSGEKRISNFLLWQLAYTELYFTDTLWPDFNEQDMDEALSWFTARQRRFGMISQIDDGETDARVSA